ncbi:hypothetical protein [Rhodoferax sp.]|uniref:hypothetical protein n=1 Tax=Rhodoferax sp. TaxID=50421 RepID=UPI0027707B55|nr:hypothetical protein [Rhodoferax sp.]
MGGDLNLGGLGGKLALGQIGWAEPNATLEKKKHEALPPSVVLPHEDLAALEREVRMLPATLA